MNLEDFKSFRRVLKPSGVGSIPTHSRQVPSVVALVAALFLAVGPWGAAASAQTADDATPLGEPDGRSVVAEDPAAATVLAADEEDSQLPLLIPPANFGEVGPGPLNRAMRSLIFPAWGQLTNGKNRKAAAVFGLQSYIWTRVILEGRKGNESQRRAERLDMEGATFAEIDQAEFAAEDHFDTRRDLVFWAMMVTLVSALEAYVDAHFGDFDRELEEGRELFGGLGPDGVEVGLRF